MLDLLVLVPYLGAVIAVGLAAVRRRRAGLEDYVLAGRTLTLPMFVATLVTTFYGGVLGVGEFAWQHGLVTWLAQGAPYYLFGAVYALWLAGRVRLTPGLTIPDHLEAVYGRKLAVFSALLLFVMMVPADEVLMLGTMLRWATGWDLTLCMVLMAAAGLVYVFRGGLRAAAWTNQVQFVSLFGGFAVLLAAAFLKLGSPLSGALPAAHLEPLGGKTLGWLAAWYFIGLWTLIDPAFHQRVAAAESVSTARKGIGISIAFWMLFDAMTTTAGLYARALLPDLSEPMLSFPLLADRLLPPLARGVFIAGLLSSMLAALDGTTLVSAYSLAKDAAGRLAEAEEERQERWTRWAIVAAAGVGLVLAAWIPSVVGLWYAVGSTVNPALLLPLLSVYFPSIRIGAGWATLSCALAWALSTGWYLWGKALGAAPLGIEPLYPGLAAACLLWLLGWMLKR